MTLYWILAAIIGIWAWCIRHEMIAFFELSEPQKGALWRSKTGSGKFWLVVKVIVWIAAMLLLLACLVLGAIGMLVLFLAAAFGLIDRVFNGKRDNG